jgi:hypothetical protein
MICHTWITLALCVCVGGVVLLCAMCVGELMPRGTVELHTLALCVCVGEVVLLCAMCFGELMPHGTVEPSRI